MWVSTQLLRDATKKIDWLDLRVLLLENQIAEKDSVLVIRDRECQEKIALVERNQPSKWWEISLAIAVALGVFLGRQ